MSANGGQCLLEEDNILSNTYIQSVTKVSRKQERKEKRNTRSMTVMFGENQTHASSDFQNL